MDANGISAALTRARAVDNSASLVIGEENSFVAARTGLGRHKRSDPSIAKRKSKLPFFIGDDCLNLLLSICLTFDANVSSKDPSGSVRAVEAGVRDAPTEDCRLSKPEILLRVSRMFLLLEDPKFCATKSSEFVLPSCVDLYGWREETETAAGDSEQTRVLTVTVISIPQNSRAFLIPVLILL